MEYKVEFSISGRELSVEEIQALQDSWVELVENTGEELSTSGGIHKYGKLDAFLDWLWITLYHG